MFLRIVASPGTVARPNSLTIQDRSLPERSQVNPAARIAAAAPFDWRAWGSAYASRNRATSEA
jgi:hypothetical protein